jgi:hypothetical protein
MIATLPKWLEAEAGVESYAWLEELRTSSMRGCITSSPSSTAETHGCVAGDPDQVIRALPGVQAAGADLLPASSARTRFRTRR